jgi:hypothetical protein
MKYLDSLTEPHLLGRNERGVGAIAEATAKVVKSPPRQKIRAREPLDRGYKGGYYFGVGENFFGWAKK